LPELPEIAIIARQIDGALRGAVISGIEVKQPKCLNRPVEEFVSLVTGASLTGTRRHGKWLCTDTDRGRLLVNLGMGGGVYLLPEAKPPEKWRVKIAFEDDRYLLLDFFWFGYVHFAATGEGHPPTDKLGPDALELTPEDFRALAAGRRGGVKSFLLDQKKIAGIGNAYVHDVLFLAGLHPLRSMSTLDDAGIGRLHRAIHEGLEPWIERGGAFGEPDLYGRGRGTWREFMRVGYKAGEACPGCGEKVVKLKTGSTSSFICPRCQPEA
jgi:formamidopyrimidine-DNA glycosylase